MDLNPRLRHPLNQVRENVDTFQTALGKGKQIDQISKPAVDLITGAFHQVSGANQTGIFRESNTENSREPSSLNVANKNANYISFNKNGKNWAEIKKIQ